MDQHTITVNVRVPDVELMLSIHPSLSTLNPKLRRGSPADTGNPSETTNKHPEVQTLFGFGRLSLSVDGAEFVQVGCGLMCSSCLKGLACRVLQVHSWGMRVDPAVCRGSCFRLSSSSTAGLCEHHDTSRLAVGVSHTENLFGFWGVRRFGSLSRRRLHLRRSGSIKIWLCLLFTYSN